MEINEIFHKNDLLDVYDRILPLSQHYSDVLSIHLDQLKSFPDVIDLGCGTGILTIRYLDEGKDVTAIDISSESLASLKEKATKFNFLNRLNIIEADISNLKGINSNSFSSASCMMVAHLVEDYQAHVRECFRVLKPGGRFVMTARRVGGDQELLVGIVKASLMGLGEFEKYKLDFELLVKNLLRTANDRSKSLFSIKEAMHIFKEEGFQNIREVFNKTQGVMYTIVADKP